MRQTNTITRKGNTQVVNCQVSTEYTTTSIPPALLRSADRRLCGPRLFSGPWGEPRTARAAVRATSSICHSERSEESALICIHANKCRCFAALSMTARGRRISPDEGWRLRPDGLGSGGRRHCRGRESLCENLLRDVIPSEARNLALSILNVVRDSSSPSAPRNDSKNRLSFRLREPPANHRRLWR